MKRKTFWLRPSHACGRRILSGNSLKQLLREIEKVFNDSTPDQMREAAESVLEKFIYDLIKENNLPLLKN
ncbi:hypothetical protein ABE07_00620 [Bacillus thuringiensis]|uniref:hypothetical protein n=1 Tax=Heyndrickxia oleronia TaxID=38875 RepID=UPI00067FDA07|nr:hypothetical protein DA68_27540 [Bacillus cereus]MBG9641325.1 hypothetical protein [Bacillus thuringiensis]MBG9648081.1 hypothetical protein [Bacillus thuringiensis]MEC1377801.1 hypothetical protein [Heyndrickxia oleronia]OHO75440.1 hypothetical protein HMPREF2590_13750 [Bacillus sp. HMSC036E02]